MKKFILFVAITVAYLLPVNVLAQEPQTKSMEELSKEIANPLAIYGTFPFSIITRQ